MNNQYSGLNGGGFESFLSRGLDKSGGRSLSGRARGNKRGYKYREGPFKGLTQGQAVEKARSMYAGLPDSVRRKYEGRASGDDIRSSREKRPVSPTPPKQATGVQGASGVQGAVTTPKPSTSTSSGATTTQPEYKGLPSASKASDEEKKRRARITAQAMKSAPKVGSIKRDDPRTAAYRKRDTYSALPPASGHTMTGR